MKNQDEAVYPEEIDRLIGALKRKLQREAAALDYPVFRINSDPIALASGSQTLIDVAEDLRALVDAFAQSLQSPRPNLTEIANAQRVSPSALRRRYRPEVVDALVALRDGSPEVDTLLAAFPSLDAGDLFGLMPALDVELRRGGESPTPNSEPSSGSSLSFLVDVSDSLKTDLPVGSAEIAAAGEQLEIEHAIIGKIAECLRTDFTTAEWTDAWVSGRGKVRLEWAGGMQVSQFLAKVLPNYEAYSKASPSSLVSGIHALRVRSWDEAKATLEWHGPDEMISVSIVRLPRHR